MTSELEKTLERIESALQVEVVNDRATVLFTTPAHHTVFARMPAEVWRAFCQRQLDAIPPQPSTTGGQK